ncbi:hypothetical protein KL905_003478 [Ogataea polymorpha]|nr:hypothetical protein KL905_003478 [Ogataea polymorpha]
MDKRYISYNNVHQLCQRAAETLKPLDVDLMIAIGGGGFIPARILRTFLKQQNRPNLRIFAIVLSLYEDLNTVSTQEEQAGAEVKRIQWINYKESGVDLCNKKILIVDEVDDTRTTLHYALRELQKDAARQAREKGLADPNTQFFVFVLHNKDKPKRAQLPAELMRGNYVLNRLQFVESAPERAAHGSSDGHARVPELFVGLSRRDFLSGYEPTAQDDEHDACGEVAHADENGGVLVLFRPLRAVLFQRYAQYRAQKPKHPGSHPGQRQGNAHLAQPDDVGRHRRLRDPDGAHERALEERENQRCREIAARNPHGQSKERHDPTGKDSHIDRAEEVAQLAHCWPAVDDADRRHGGHHGRLVGVVAERPRKVGQIVHERHVAEQREHDPREKTPDAEVRPHNLVVHFVDGLDMLVARLDQRDGDEVEKRTDYGLCAHRPLVAVSGEQGLHSDVVQDATEPGPRRREAQREIPLASLATGKPLRDHHDAGNGNQRERHALPDALGEHQLPVLGAERRQQHRRELERNSYRDRGLEPQRAHEIVNQRSESESGAKREPAHHAVLVLGCAGEHVRVEVLLVVERIGGVGTPGIKREQHAADHGREPAAPERVWYVAGHLGTLDGRHGPL